MKKALLYATLVAFAACKNVDCKAPFYELQNKCQPYSFEWVGSWQITQHSELPELVGQTWVITSTAPDSIYLVEPELPVALSSFTFGSVQNGSYSATLTRAGQAIEYTYSSPITSGSFLLEKR